MHKIYIPVADWTDAARVNEPAVAADTVVPLARVNPYIWLYCIYIVYNISDFKVFYFVPFISFPPLIISPTLKFLTFSSEDTPLPEFA